MVASPDWTDFNESDPGISLVQVFAFLACALLLTAWIALRRRRARPD